MVSNNPNQRGWYWEERIKKEEVLQAQAMKDWEKREMVESRRRRKEVLKRSKEVSSKLEEEKLLREATEDELRTMRELSAKLGVSLKAK